MARIGSFEVGSQGLGGMSLSGLYGRSDDGESRATLRHALDLGVTFFDTATAYGAGHNERLFGDVLRARRSEVVVASKFLHRIEGRRIDAREAVEASLGRLGFDHIDLYYLHRVDPEIPVEDSVGQLGRLVEEGKIGGVGLSEASAAQLLRAHGEYPVTALQSEYSLWSRDVEAEILPLARELGIGFVGFSPLGRGFLAGALPTDADDRRNVHPRYREEAIAQNERRRRQIEAVAGRIGATPAQVCIAWVQAKGVVPIPGTRHVRHLDDNWAANAIKLDAATIAELDGAFPHGTTAGDRFPPEQMKHVPVPPVPAPTAA